MFQHSMAHEHSDPGGLHMQAITDSSKSVYRCLRGTPTVQYIPSRPRNGQQRASLRQCQHCLSALFHCLAILDARAVSLFLWARAPHPPLFLPPPSPHSHAMQVALYLRSIFFLHAFHVLPRSRPRPLPGCSLISCSFLEASVGLRCRPPPACGGAPCAVLACNSDDCCILKTIGQR